MTSPVGADRRRDLDRFYELLDRLSARLGGPRRLGQSRGADGWPERGVYFFFEEGELREGGPPRVVRVGTHAVSQGSRTSFGSAWPNTAGLCRGRARAEGTIAALFSDSTWGRHFSTEITTRPRCAGPGMRRRPIQSSRTRSMTSSER